MFFPLFVTFNFKVISILFKKRKKKKGKKASHLHLGCFSVAVAQRRILKSGKLHLFLYTVRSVESNCCCKQELHPIVFICLVRQRIF